ncbi:MAG: hypothetical protein JSS96_04120 [Bacteroidetes bacterium]|nr:hypothetical protein [Bacteroidota bacterium]
MLLRIITWGILIVVLYRFLARYILPIFHITRMAGDHLQKMQKQMEQMDQKNNPVHNNSQRVNKGDYIDYEEVK